MIVGVLLVAAVSKKVIFVEILDKVFDIFLNNMVVGAEAILVDIEDGISVLAVFFETVDVVVVDLSILVVVDAVEGSWMDPNVIVCVSVSMELK